MRKEKKQQLIKERLNNLDYNVIISQDALDFLEHIEKIDHIGGVEAFKLIDLFLCHFDPIKTSHITITDEMYIYYQALKKLRDENQKEVKTKQFKEITSKDENQFVRKKKKILTNDERWRVIDSERRKEYNERNPSHRVTTIPHMYMGELQEDIVRCINELNQIRPGTYGDRYYKSGLNLNYKKYDVDHMEDYDDYYKTEYFLKVIRISTYTLLNRWKRKQETIQDE